MLHFRIGADTGYDFANYLIVRQFGILARHSYKIVYSGRFSVVSEGT